MLMHYLLIVLSVWISVSQSEIQQDSFYYQKSNPQTNYPVLLGQLPAPHLIPIENRLSFNTVLNAFLHPLLNPLVYPLVSSWVQTTTEISTSTTICTVSTSAACTKRSLNDDILLDELIKPSPTNKVEPTETNSRDMESSATKRKRETYPHSGFWRDSYGAIPHYEPQSSLFGGTDQQFSLPYFFAIPQRRPIVPAHLARWNWGSSISPIVLTVGVSTIVKTISSTPTCSTSSGFSACI